MVGRLLSAEREQRPEAFYSSSIFILVLWFGQTDVYEPKSELQYIVASIIARTCLILNDVKNYEHGQNRFLFILSSQK